MIPAIPGRGALPLTEGACIPATFPFPAVPLPGLPLFPASAGAGAVAGVICPGRTEVFLLEFAALFFTLFVFTPLIFAPPPCFTRLGERTAPGGKELLRSAPLPAMWADVCVCATALEMESPPSIAAASASSGEMPTPWPAGAHLCPPLCAAADGDAVVCAAVLCWETLLLVLFWLVEAAPLPVPEPPELPTPAGPLKFGFPPLAFAPAPLPELPCAPPAFLPADFTTLLAMERTTV